MNERTAVYRLYGEDGSLLYIGMTNRPEVRWKQHEALKSWWNEVVKTELAWFNDRDGAAKAEHDAIRAERPAYNIKSGRMAIGNAPRHAFRFKPELWTAFRQAVARDPMGRTMAEVMRDLLGWYTWEDWAPDPVQPPEQAFLAAVKRDPLGRNVTEVVHDLVGWYVREKPGDPVRPPKPPAS